MIRKILIVIGLAFLGTTAGAGCSENAVTLRGDWGQARFSVEIADTAEERSRGLMFRESLPQSSGMLFIF